MDTSEHGLEIRMDKLEHSLGVRVERLEHEMEVISAQQVTVTLVENRRRQERFQYLDNTH